MDTNDLHNLHISIGWPCCCPWCWTLTFNWTWYFKNIDNFNFLKAEGPHLNGINVTNLNGHFLLCPQGCPGWATAHYKERPLESGCHGESCKTPKKKGREETWKQLEARASRGGASESWGWFSAGNRFIPGWILWCSIKVQTFLTSTLLCIDLVT